MAPSVSYAPPQPKNVCMLAVVSEETTAASSEQFSVSLFDRFTRNYRRYAALSALGGTLVGVTVLPLTDAAFLGVELWGMVFWVAVALVFSIGLMRTIDSPKLFYYFALAAACAGMNGITHSMATRDGAEVLLTLFVTICWTTLSLPPRMVFLATVYAFAAPLLSGARFVPSTLQVIQPGDINMIMLGMICTLGFCFSLAFEKATQSLKELHAQQLRLSAATRTKLEDSLRVRAEELEISRSQVLRGEKARTLGTLAAGLAHELNNILTPARGFAEILANGETSPAQTADFGRRILDATVASTAITGALLTYTKQSVFSPEPVNLRNLLNVQIRPVLAQVLPHNIELEINCPRKFALIVDAQLFQQCIMNLVINSVDAMPNGGHIHLHARTVQSDARTTLAEISIRDDGLGMTESQRNQIFVPFYTTKAHGTGLGLPTVQGIVERHGGEIHIESAPEVGTTVTLRIPMKHHDVYVDDEGTFHSNDDDGTSNYATLFSSDEDLLDEFEEMLSKIDISLLRGPAMTSETSFVPEERLKFVDTVFVDIDDWSETFESAVQVMRTHFPLVHLVVLSSSSTSVAAIRRTGGHVSSLRKPVDKKQLNSILTVRGFPNVSQP